MACRRKKAKKPLNKSKCKVNFGSNKLPSNQKQKEFQLTSTRSHSSAARIRSGVRLPEEALSPLDKREQQAIGTEEVELKRRQDRSNT